MEIVIIGIVWSVCVFVCTVTILMIELLLLLLGMMMMAAAAVIVLLGYWCWRALGRVVRVGGERG